MPVIPGRVFPDIGDEDYTIGPAGSGIGGADPTWTTWSLMRNALAGSNQSGDIFIRVTGDLLNTDDNLRSNLLGCVDGSRGTWKAVFYSHPSERGSGAGGLPRFTVTNESLGVIRNSSGDCDFELHGCECWSSGGYAIHVQSSAAPGVHYLFDSCRLFGRVNSTSGSSVVINLPQSNILRADFYNCVCFTGAGTMFWTAGAGPQAVKIINCTVEQANMFTGGFDGWTGEQDTDCCNTIWLGYQRVQGAKHFYNCTTNGPNQWGSQPNTNCLVGVDAYYVPTETGVLFKELQVDWDLLEATTGLNQAVDNGTVDDYTEFDALGRARGTSLPPDIGAFELQAAPTGDIEVSGTVQADPATSNGTVEGSSDISGAVVPKGALLLLGSTATGSDISGATAADQATSSGNLESGTDIAGTIAADEATSSGSLESSTEIAGTTTADPATLSGTVDVVAETIDISGTVQPDPSLLSGTVDVVQEIIDVSGTVQPDAATSAGAVDSSSEIAGTVAGDPATLAGAVEGLTEIGGSTAAGLATTAGLVSVEVEEIEISGTVQPDPAQTSALVEGSSSVGGSTTADPAATSGLVENYYPVWGTVVADPATSAGQADVGSDIAGTVQGDAASTAGGVSTETSVSGTVASGLATSSGSVIVGVVGEYRRIITLTCYVRDAADIDCFV